MNLTSVLPVVDFARSGFAPTAVHEDRVLFTVFWLLALGKLFSIMGSVLMALVGEVCGFSTCFHVPPPLPLVVVLSAV